MGLVEDYLDVHTQSIAKYGEKTLVLCEVGLFFEFYSDSTRGPDVEGVCMLLNIQATRKNKSVQEVSVRNPKLGGFPSSKISKYEPLLMDDGFTVVYLNQHVIVNDSLLPHAIERVVTRVVSRTTNMDYQDTRGSHNDTCSLMVLNLETTPVGSLVFGCASIDTLTGATKTYEFSHASPNDLDRPWEELLKAIEAERPGEVLVFSHDGTQIQESKVNLKTVHVHKSKRVKKDTLAYQNEVLRKVYGCDSLLSPIEYVGLERQPYALEALVALLEFAYEHDEKLTEKALPPDCMFDDSMLHTNHGTGIQLDMPVLIKLINKCSTAMGRRMFAERFTKPLTDKRAIDARLDEVSSLVTKYKPIREALHTVCDLERVWRRVVTKRLTPGDLSIFYASIERVSRVVDSPAIFKIMARISGTINLEEYNGTQIFVKGVFPEVDAMQAFIEHSKELFQKVAREINVLTGKEHAKADDLAILMTPTRFAALMSKFGESRVAGFYVSEFTLNDAKTVVHPFLVETALKAGKVSLALSSAIDATFASFVAQLESEYSKDVRTIVRTVASLDVASTCAFLAATRRYNRPIIAEKEKEMFINAVGLRHPIVEIINEAVEYVPNDVSITSRSSMLLYGINAGGKSTAMKAVGIAVMMAQSGMFVACERLELTPFKSLFTRIGMRDDILKGHSTFMVEMLEVRNILKRCDEDSLVLGDEICSGTESLSALSIVGASLGNLCNRGVPFMFATHLHELLEIEDVQTLVKSQNIGVFHVSTTRDEKSGLLVYDRLIHPGPGSQVYGLEVCRAIGMDPEFMRSADRIRRRVSGVPEELVRRRTSRYNAKLIVDRCSLCGKPATETHHIKHRADADCEGFVGVVRLNRKSNLVPLCSACHTGMHTTTGAVEVAGFVQTTMGVMLGVAPPNDAEFLQKLQTYNKKPVD
jgi:DNA mismatch repair protein MutS